MRSILLFLLATLPINALASGYIDPYDLVFKVQQLIPSSHSWIYVLPVVDESRSLSPKEINQVNVLVPTLLQRKKHLVVPRKWRKQVVSSLQGHGKIIPPGAVSIISIRHNQSFWEIKALDSATHNSRKTLLIGKLTLDPQKRFSPKPTLPKQPQPALVNKCPQSVVFKTKTTSNAYAWLAGGFWGSALVGAVGTVLTLNDISWLEASEANLTQLNKDYANTCDTSDATKILACSAQDDFKNLAEETREKLVSKDSELIMWASLTGVGVLGGALFTWLALSQSDESDTETTKIQPIIQPHRYGLALGWQL